MNSCIISGNLGKDPEIHFSTEGTQITTFPLAFNSSRNNTSWIKCVSFNKTAEIAEKYLHSGARVLVQGSLNQSKWEDKNGEQRSAFEFICNNIEFLKTDGRGFDGEQHQEGTPPF
jgi:single-strand DNA-binding protein